MPALGPDGMIAGMFEGSAGEKKRRLHGLAAETGVRLPDLRDCVAIGQPLKDDPHHDAGAFEAGLAVADVGIDRNVLSPVHVDSISPGAQGVKAAEVYGRGSIFDERRICLKAAVRRSVP